MDADIAVKDGAVAAIVDSKSSGFYADQVHEAQGCMVLPGLVDFHTHVYWGGTPLGINPEKLAPLTGVTTWVDMGSAGAGNFEGLYYHILKRSSLNIFCFLHLSYIGLVPVGDTKLRFGELFDSRLADVSEAARLCAAFPDAIKGLKLRLGMESSLTEGLAYLDMALALGERLGLPVVVHATSAPPTTAQVLSRLRAGDIYTHCFSSSPTSGILDRSGRLLPAALDAKARGVRFDLGYGARSFDSVVAAAAIAQGFLPDFVSSDLHAYSLGSTISGLPAVMAALCHAGLSLEEVILRATAYPAEYLGLSGGATPSRVGRLAVGSPADICILAWSEQDGDMVDGSGRVIRAPALEVRGVYRRGERLQAFDDGRQEGRWKPGLVGKKP
jgi:dihydroorotase